MIPVTVPNRKSLAVIIAWCLYDSAACSFSIIVTTFIFATYFTTKIAINPIVGTYQWANAASLAGLIIAFSSPLFGAMADYGGQLKRWLFAFTLVCVISSALLWFAYPNIKSIYFTLACFVVGTIGFEVALVFYNAFLSQLVEKKYLGRVSGWGWGAGYLGGIVALTIALFVFVKPKFAWLDTSAAEQIRICGPFVALWYLLFSIPLFVLVPNVSSASHPLPQAIRIGTSKLLQTLKQLPQQKNIFIFFISHMIYTDGLNTLFAFGGIYAAGTFGLTFEEVLLFGITMNIAAGIGAATFAWVDDYVGSKPTVLVSLVCLILFGAVLLFLHDKTTFWIVALFLCLFVGPVQSASRTLMVKIITDQHAQAEMFGLYAVSGRITAFIGPWILGLLTLTFNSQRVGMSTMLLFFLVGGLLLLFVKVDEK